MVDAISIFYIIALLAFLGAILYACCQPKGSKITDGGEAFLSLIFKVVFGGFWITCLINFATSFS